MKINFIGDIHGRTIWKELVKDDHVNVFIGDYFSPYDKISFDEQRENFMDIIMYKEKHPETVLLLGNHDEEYWHIPETYSRHDKIHEDDILKLFVENEDLGFQIAYAPDEHVLATHAGVTAQWYYHYCVYNMPYQNECIYDARNVANAINQLYNDTKDRQLCPFAFNPNSSMYDYYGDSCTHSPIWVRGKCLYYNNLFRNNDVVQVVGHTIVKRIEAFVDSETEKEKIYFIDTLGVAKKTLQYDTETKKFSFENPVYMDNSNIQNYIKMPQL